jgi:hypothetical protein
LSKDSSVMWYLSTKNLSFSLPFSRWSIQISFLQCSRYLGCLTCWRSSLLASIAFFFLCVSAMSSVSLSSNP